MTREEAISWLVSLTEHEGEDVPIYDTDVEAIDMAISALEHPEKNVVAVVPCGDCISRADVLKLMQDNWHTHNGDWAMQESMDDIRVLPSVTPQEPQTFKWCIDCKEYDQEKHCCHRYSKVIRDTAAEIRQEPKTGHWIDIMVGDMPAQACDRCDTFYPLAYTGGGHKYCPNCGAKMVEPQESEKE